MLTGATCRQQTRILEMHILVSPLSLVDRIYVSLSQNKIYEIISNYNYDKLISYNLIIRNKYSNIHNYYEYYGKG